MVKVMIHAVPERMWYVEGFQIPALERQGADEIRVWCDDERRGNLRSCMDAFAACDGDGATWHIQDDVLLCRDFIERCRSFDDGVVFGFCCVYFLDDPAQTGRVYMPDAWHSFQCVRIPDAWARECAEWYFSGAWEDALEGAELTVLNAAGKGDDGFFREFLLERHGDGTVTNAKPNLVEHVDLLLGGSVLHKYRDYPARAHYWHDELLVADLRAQLRERRLGSWAPPP